MTAPLDVYTAEEVAAVARQVLDDVPAPRVVEELIRRLRAIHATMPERAVEVTPEIRAVTARRVKGWKRG